MGFQINLAVITSIDFLFTSFWVALLAFFFFFHLKMCTWGKMSNFSVILSDCLLAMIYDDSWKKSSSFSISCLCAWNTGKAKQLY